MQKALNTQTLCYIIFSIGIVSSVAIIIAAVVAVAYILNIAMIELCHIASNITFLYSHSDSLVQLCILLILAFLFYKLVCIALRSVRKELQAW